MSHTQKCSMLIKIFLRDVFIDHFESNKSYYEAGSIDSIAKDAKYKFLINLINRYCHD